MDALAKRASTAVDAEISNFKADRRPSRAEAEAAVRTLIRWAGENPDREGLLDTPKRVVKAYEEHFQGYGMDPADALERTFEEVEGYDDMVLLRAIPFQSRCEHHLEAIIGHAHVAYMPDGRVVGLSKLARVVDIFAKRMQVQEKMTTQIAQAIETGLMPRGVAVVISAEHQCMSCRGVMKSGVDTITSQFNGVFKTDRDLRQRFLDSIR